MGTTLDDPNVMPPEFKRLEDQGYLVRYEKDLGRWYRYARPEDVAAARIGSAGIPAEFLAASFETYQLPDPRYQTTRNTVEAWMDNFPKSHDAIERRLQAGTVIKSGLFLGGSTGVGKTHLGVSILRRFAGMGRGVRFYTFSRMLNEFRMGFDGEQPEYFADEIDVLMIDEFSIEKPSDPLADKMRFILFERLSNFRPTILTSNELFPGAGGGLEKLLGDRLISRMRRNYELIHISTLPDWRESKACEAAAPASPENPKQGDLPW